MGGKIALGLLGIVVVYAFFSAEEVEPAPEGVCDTDEFGCVEIARAEPLLLATFLDRSGPKSEVGEDSLHGILLAADYIDGSFDGESARFLGREIAFEHKDDRCSVLGKNAIRELLTESQYVLAVIGGTCDAPVLGVSDQILSDEGILMLSPSATRSELDGPDRQPFFFRTAHNATLETVALARFAVEELQSESAALMHVIAYDAGVYEFDRAFRRLGATTTERVSMDRKTRDVEGLAHAIARSMGRHLPETIYLPVLPKAAATTIRAAHDHRLREIPMLTQESWLSAEAIPTRTIARGQALYLAGPDLDFSGRFYDEEFLPAYRARFGEPTSSYHAHAFDAALLVLHAIEDVAILDTTDDILFIPRTSLRDAIAATKNFEGVSGLLTCGDSADCNPDAPMLVRKFVDGRSTVVWRSTDL